MNTIIKINRFAAWVLMVVILIYAVTGFGMTKGVIDQDFSSSFHLSWLGLIGLPAFIIHCGWQIHLSLIRWRVWNIASKIFLGIFLLAIIIFFVYLHFFYSQYYKAENTLYNYNESSSLSQTNENQDNPTNLEGVFTSETLSQYNGLNGQPAYIAVDGLVYDVSSLFKNGRHYTCKAGEDVTSGFYAKHLKTVLNNFEVVGKYQKD